MRILCVDDDAAFREMLESRLSTEGHQVISADNGKSALELFQQKEFQILITDWQMPEMDGLELIRHIRDIPAAENLYILLISGQSRQENLAKVLNCGADDFLGKPFDWQDLRQRLRQVENLLTLRRNITWQQNRIDEMAALQRNNRRLAESIWPMRRANGPSTCRRVQLHIHQESGQSDFHDIFNTQPVNEHYLVIYLLTLDSDISTTTLLSIYLDSLFSRKAAECAACNNNAGDTDSFQKRLLNSYLEAILEDAGPAEADWRGHIRGFCLGIVDLNRHHLYFLNSGSSGMAFLSADERMAIASDDPADDCPMAKQSENSTIAPIKEPKIVKMKAGDRFYIYSGGLSRTANAAGDPLGNRRCFVSLRKHRKMNLGGCIDSMRQIRLAWGQYQPPEDDITIFGMEIEI